MFVTALGHLGLNDDAPLADPLRPLQPLPLTVSAPHAAGLAHAPALMRERPQDPCVRTRTERRMARPPSARPVALDARIQQGEELSEARSRRGWPSATAREKRSLSIGSLLTWT